METSKSTPSKDLKIFMNYRRLRDIKRCNNFPVANREDVAQHSFYVTMLATAIAKEYNDYAGSNNLGYHPYDDEHRMDIVDVTQVTMKAMCHDLEEAFTSDIPYNVKHHSDTSHKVIQKVIKDKMDTVYQGCTAIMSWFKTWNDTCKDDLSGQFVDISDMLELSIFCWEELAMGNVAMESMLVKSLTIIKDHTLYPILVESSPLFKGIMELIDDPDVMGSMYEILDIS